MTNTWAELHLDVLKGNILALKSVLKPSAELIAVVKADAYGHGMTTVAQCAHACGVQWFAVAHIDEAAALRAVLPEARILVVGVIDKTEVPAAIEHDIICLVVSDRHAEALGSAATAHHGGRVLKCHAKVDTGMGRLGFDWSCAAGNIVRLADHPGLDICGICSHFASSNGLKKAFPDIQAERFRKVTDACEKNGLSGLFRHISNSGAIQRDAEWDWDGVRPGIMLYGYSDGTRPRLVETKPFLHWKTRIVQIKRVPAGFPVSYDSTYVTTGETNLATINVGYSDGYPRLLSNRGFVLIGGERRPVLGRVTMNLTVVNLGPQTTAGEGDEVVLIGSQGCESIWADEIAGWAQTIPYEILTGVRTSSRRVAGPASEGR